MFFILSIFLLLIVLLFFIFTWGISLSPSNSMMSDYSESFSLVIDCFFLRRAGFLVYYYYLMEVPPVSPLSCSRERAEDMEFSCGLLYIIWSINLRLEDLSGSLNCNALSVLMFLSWSINCLDGIWFDLLPVKLSCLINEADKLF